MIVYAKVLNLKKRRMKHLGKIHMINCNGYIHAQNIMEASHIRYPVYSIPKDTFNTVKQN